MNHIRTAGDLIECLSKLPSDTIILQPKDASDSEFISLSGASLMYVDKYYDGGYTDEIWDEDDLLDQSDELDKDNVLSNFQQVLVLWID